MLSLALLNFHINMPLKNVAHMIEKIDRLQNILI